MFSQWATKRVCKFFVKRLLGRMLRSELDLEQLEVQLGFGTIQLKDLFLNTEYLNEQLGDASIAIKEGSMGSLRAKIPWKVWTAESCEIQVDELKIVIVPRAQCKDNGSGNPAPSGSEDLRFIEYPLSDGDTSGLGTAGGGVYMGVDDGVRMIAKMVERVLLGLQVKVTNMIIVFEEQVEKISDGVTGDMGAHNRPLQTFTPPHCLLIARVASLEYGVEAPHEDLQESVKDNNNGVEPSMLVKVVKFKGATVEVVDVQDKVMENERVADDPAAVNVPLTCFLGQPVFILVGESGGLAGSIQLSVPWKDGTVDAPKIHADIFMGPIKLKLSPHQIQQLLSLTQTFSRGEALSADSSPVVPVLESSVLSGSTLGIGTGSRFHSATASDRSSELLKTFSGRGIEADSSSTASLPGTTFISDWIHRAGSTEEQQRDGAVAEADLAASVDEFFECFDGTRSSQASFSNSGMWNWTRSAFSAITAASSVAAGSILLLPPDPPKQPEYSMKARLARVSLDLHYYESASSQKNSLVPTLASELFPVKEVVSSSEGQSLQGATSLEGSAEECLKAELSELNLSVMVSGSQTDFSVTIKDLDVSESVLTEVVEETQLFGMSSYQSDVENSAPIFTQVLQSSIETVLPSFPALLSPKEPRAESPRENMGFAGRNMMDQEGLVGGQPPGQPSRDKYEKKRLLRVLCGPDYAARVTVTWQHRPLGSRVSSRQTEITASVEPVVIWLDVHTLKRIELLMQKSKDSSTERNKPAKDSKRSHKSSAVQQIESLQKRRVSAAHNDDTVKGNAGERDPFQVKLFAPCLRVIICFPAQKDFVALDMIAPAAKSGILQPIVDFEHLGEKKTGTSSSVADKLTFCIGDLKANLVSSIDESHRGHNGGNSFTFTADEILLISQQDSTLDRQSEEGASVELQWHDGAKISSWIPKRAWDGVAAQQSQGDCGRGIGGSNLEFAAATTAAEAVEEENSQVRKELIDSSSSIINVNIPQIRCRLSEPQYTRVLELIGSFVDALILFKDEESGAERNIVDPGPFQPQKTTSDTLQLASPSVQTSILVQCGHVDVALHLKAQHQCSGVSKQGTKAWDVIRLNLEKLQVLSVLGIGGFANSSYLWVHHEDIEVTGSFPAESEMLLLCCKSEALARGDGGGGNALASGKAGVTITHMVWPSQEPLGDALLTGTIRGLTVVAHSGRLDWLSAVSLFFKPSDQMEGSEEIKSGLDDPSEIDSKPDPAVSSARTCTYFLLDFNDVAFCYEPGSEKMLAPGRRPARDAAESSQFLAPVACVVAAAAMRLSSSVVPRVTGEQYDIWLRDGALHLLDTALRKQTSFDYSAKSMRSTGYVQVAKAAVMEALVRLDGESGLLWEVESANNQLRFDTCHDTTAAFGRLVAQIQELLAPEILAQSANVTTWRADGRGSGAESPSFISRRLGTTADMRNGADVEEANSINLFDGVSEDAFSHTRSSGSSAVGDDDDDDAEDLQGETYTVINVPLHSKVSSKDRHEFLDRGRQDLSGPVNKSGFSTPTRQPRPVSQTPSEDSVETGNTGLPTLIEDHYVTTQKHSSPPLEIMVSRQTWHSPGESAGSSRNASRESTSSGGGRKAEGKAVWYPGKGLEVVEDHVPDETARLKVGQPGQRSGHNRNSSLPKKYPPSVGRVVLRDLRAKWRFYGGSDWPTGRAGQDQRSASQSGSEESGRQAGVCLEVLLDGMDLQHDSFAAVGVYASRLVLSIRDIGVYDCSRDAPWRKVLGYHRSKSRPRESSSQAVKLEMDSVRPDPLAPLEEYRLAIALLPIRLHLDQSHIDFCIKFFPLSPKSPTDGGLCPDEGSYPSAGFSISGVPEFPLDTNDSVGQALLPFFQICEMQPFTVRVDYLPRRVDLTSLRRGNYAELLNLVTWKGIEVDLKHVKAAGVYGWSSVLGLIFGEWLEDISQNQVHKFVQGVGPIRPLYAVGSGAAKLVVIPTEHYRKDRRLLRGMRKGAVAFLRSISLEALGLGAHLAAGAHEILQQTELALGGTPSEKGDRRRRAFQPGDTLEGLQQAFESILQGLESAAALLVSHPLKVYQRGAGPGVAVVTALRAAPAAAVAPASAAANAVHRALLGVRNELDPEKKRESDEKHTGPPPDTGRVR